jgi:hypothetical protein
MDLLIALVKFNRFQALIIGSDRVKLGESLGFCLALSLSANQNSDALVPER